MSRGKERDWIRWAGDGTLSCERCGQSYTMALPAPIPIVIAIARAFSELHRGCKAKDPGA